MDVRAFLALRRPAPPDGLAVALTAGAREGEIEAGLANQGLAELARCRTVRGRVRESAWHLLAADALLTYACEAALEGSDPPRAFEELLRKAASGEA